jgi:hypothetical protein
MSSRAWANALSLNTPAPTAGAGRRGKRLRQLPGKLKLDLDHLAIAEGRVIFIRSVSGRGRISLLGQNFQIGRRHKFAYVKTVLDTRRQRLTVYLAGKILKRSPYKLSRH